MPFLVAIDGVLTGKRFPLDVPLTLGRSLSTPICASLPSNKWAVSAFFPARDAEGLSERRLSFRMEQLSLRRV